MGVGCAALALLITAAQGETAPEPLSVGVHLPGVFFAGTAEQASFLTAVETALTEALGQPVTASLIGDAKGLERETIWIADATEVARRDGPEVVLRGAGATGNDVPMALYASKAWKNAFALLSNGRVAIGAGGGAERDAVRYWLLWDEPGAASIAKRIKTVRDARSALVAVAAGELDGALVPRAAYKEIDVKLGGLQEVGWLNNLPLPVLAINKGALPTGVTVDALAKKLREAKLPRIPGMVERWAPGSFDAELRGLGSTVRGKRTPASREIVFAAVKAPKLGLAGLLPAIPDMKPLDASLVIPPQRLGALPDPPEPAESSAPVALGEKTGLRDR